jgi:Kef-type K+ transport system membrane component KefB
LLDDVLVLLALGLAPAAAGAFRTGAAGPLGLAALKLAALLALVAAAGWFCRVWSRQDGDTRLSHAARPVPALLLILAMAAASESLGLHFAIGAFLGALTVSKYGNGADAPHSLHPPTAALNDLLFAPLFLATQGVHMIAIGPAQAGFTLALTGAAVASKLAGGYTSARLFGLSRRDSRGVAIILNTRGVMAMVAASIAFRTGLIDSGLYSSLLASCVAATFCTLLLLRHWQSRQPNSGMSLS